MVNNSEECNTITSADFVTPFKAINIVVLVLELWFLLCMVFYGTKTRRWTQQFRASSLNNGAVYIACTVVIILQLPQMIETLIFLGRERECELHGKINSLANSLSSNSFYVFIWIRQRIIYRHPFVKDRISKSINRISKLFILVLIPKFALYVIVSVLFNQYSNDCSNICFKGLQDTTFSSMLLNILLIVVQVVAQILLMVLSLYPSVYVNFEAPLPLHIASKKKFGHCSCLTSCCAHWYRTLFGDGNSVSPISVSVERAALCSLIVAIIDTTSWVIVTFAVQMLDLVVTIHNIGNMLEVLCMIGTFPFALKIYFFFLPSISLNYHFKASNIQFISKSEN